MLQAAALFVGSRLPSGLDCIHVPDGNLEDIAGNILTRWTPKADPVTTRQA
jgi:hypothetical protein